jgi:predicted DNA-binding transcriptional regulator YafY
VGSGLEIYHKDQDCWLDIDGSAIQYMLPLSPSEWMELDQILKGQKSTFNTALTSLKRKVSENGPVKVVMELLNELELWDVEMTEHQMITIKALEDAIASKNLIHLISDGDKSFQLHPWKVIHLEGQLSLIAEDHRDHGLLILPLREVKSFQCLPSVSAPRVSAFEVEEFISAIRAMNEKETRLILKIHDPQSTNLFPDHHFLGKPCMITNSNGDLIWAAYVEPCEALYDWLMTLGRNVEILDPIKFKEEYLSYCEEKLRKIA